MHELFDNRSEAFIQWLNHQWNIEFKCIRRDFKIQGSPERTLSRAVIQDKGGTLYLLEKFPQSKFDIRRNVANAVKYLNKNGLEQALGCQRSNNGELLPFFNGACFQISFFLHGTGIKRPDYLSSPQVGRSFALFLTDLHKASKNIQKQVAYRPFSIKKYIYKLFNEMKIYDEAIFYKYSRFLTFLEKKFMTFHDKLPVSFCHGDLHPLNVIWDHDHIKAVIDWEFTGFKPDIYDAANIVGCAGIEDPEGLGMPMVLSFIETLKNSGIISREGWCLFPEYILALRFAWLAEWLRKKDEEMLEMEACYLGILIDNADILKKIWKIDIYG